MAFGNKAIFHFESFICDMIGIKYKVFRPSQRKNRDHVEQGSRRLGEDVGKARMMFTTVANA